MPIQDPLAIVALGREGSGEAQILPQWRDRGPELGLLMRADEIARKKAEAERKEKEDAEAKKMLETFKSIKTFVYDQGILDKNLGSIKDIYVKKKSAGTLTPSEESEYTNVMNRLMTGYMVGSNIQEGWGKQMNDLLANTDKYDYEASMENARYFTNYKPTKDQIDGVKLKYGGGIDPKVLSNLDDDFWKITARNEFAKDKQGNLLMDNFLVTKAPVIEYGKDIQPLIEPTTMAEKGSGLTGWSGKIVANVGKITEQVDGLLKTEIGINYAKQEINAGRQPDLESVKRFIIDDNVARVNTSKDSGLFRDTGNVEDLLITDMTSATNQISQKTTSGLTTTSAQGGSWQFPPGKNMIITLNTGYTKNTDDPYGIFKKEDGTAYTGALTANISGSSIGYYPVAKERVIIKNRTYFKNEVIDANDIKYYKGVPEYRLKVTTITEGGKPALFDAYDNPTTKSFASKNKLSDIITEEDFNAMFGITPEKKTETKKKTTTTGKKFNYLTGKYE